MKKIISTIGTLTIIAAWIGLFVFLAAKTAAEKPLELTNRDFAPPCEWCTD